MRHSGLIISPDGSWEFLGTFTDVNVLEEEIQSPVLKVFLQHLGITLCWSERHYEYNQVNDRGSMLSGTTVKGDCCIIHSSYTVGLGGEEILSMLSLPSVKEKESQYTLQCPPFKQQQQCHLLHQVTLECLLPLSLHEQPLVSNTADKFMPLSHTPAKQHDQQRPVQQQAKSQQQPTLPDMPQQPEVPCWTDLPPELVSLIYQSLSKAFSASLPLMQTCKAFRQVAFDDHHILMRVWFNLADVRNPFKAASKPVRPKSGNSLHGSGSRCSDRGDETVGSNASSSGHVYTHSCSIRSNKQGSGSATPLVRRLLPLQSESQLQKSQTWSTLDSLIERLHDTENEYNLETCAATHARGSKRVTGGPQWGLQSGLVKPQAAWAGMSAVPAPLARAAHYGNPSACAVMAQLLEASGTDNDCEVLLFWRRSAKYGDVEAMLKLGFALYQGTCGCATDVDAAHTWLSKAVRSLLGGLSSLSQLSVDLTNGLVTISASATPVVAAAAATANPASPPALDASQPNPKLPSNDPTCPLTDLDAASGVLTEGGLMVPGKPYTAPLWKLLKIGCSIDQRKAAAAAATMAFQALSVAGTAPPASSGKRRHLDVNSIEAADDNPEQQAPQERVRRRVEEQQLQQQRIQHDELLLQQRRLKRVEGQSEVARVAYDDPALMPMLQKAAELLGYIYFDGEAGIKADQVQACALFKLAALAGSMEAARVLGWIYSTGQYGG